MRALLIVFEWSRAGGLETATLQIARELAAIGVEVDVWSVMQHGAAEVDGIPARGLAPGGRLARSLNGRFFWPVRLAREVARAAREYDLVIAGHASLLPSVRRGLSTLRTRPACWVWTYGIEVWGAAGQALAADLAWVDRAIAISGFTRDQLRAWIPAERIDVIAPYVDTAVFTPDPSVPVQRDEVLITGRMARAEAYKGHEVLFAALPLAEEMLGRPLRLRVVGDGDLRAELEAAAKDAGIGDRVEFTGRIPFDGLVEAYRRCAVFAMPSRVERRPAGLWTGEGLGIVYLEAQACGRPVVASTDGGAPDTVEAGRSGVLADPADPRAVAAALAELLGDPGRADEMGRAGRAFVEANFSAGRFRDRLRALVASPRGAFVERVE
jgi:phosphatidylinositol alpha-1,6-mannosyltransferase